MTRSAHVARTVFPLLALSLLGLTGCGNAHEPPVAPDTSLPSRPVAPDDEASPSAPEAQAYSDSRSSAAPATPAPAAGARNKAAARGSEAAGAAADSAYQPAPEKTRPGLGTEWGETRESRVSSAPFERESWSTPVSVTSFFYNDETGVRAMLGSEQVHSERRADGVLSGRGAISIRLIDSSGAPLPSFASRGRSYVVGDDGARYAIRIENQTGARFEAVASVDGLDVIDGQPGSYEKRGYLVGPWSTLEIDGFRQSSDAVAAFRFGRVRDSYAAKRGNDRHVGVIGVAVFQERGSEWPWMGREIERRHGADAFPGRFAPPPPRY